MLAGYLLDSLKKERISCPDEKAMKIVSIMRERVTFPADFWKQGKFFFVAPTVFDEQVVAKKWNDETAKVFNAYSEEVENLDGLTAVNAKDLLEQVTSKLGVKTGQILQMLRMGLTGGASGPDLMMTMEILGGAEVSRRLRFAVNTFKVKVG